MMNDEQQTQLMNGCRWRWLSSVHHSSFIIHRYLLIPVRFRPIDNMAQDD